jgi:hypothetical protein
VRPGVLQQPDVRRVPMVQHNQLHAVKPGRVLDRRLDVVPQGRRLGEHAPVMHLFAHSCMQCVITMHFDSIFAHTSIIRFDVSFADAIVIQSDALFAHTSIIRFMSPSLTQ